MNGTTYINSNTVDEIAVSSNGKYVYWLSESDGISRATDYGDTITHWHSKPNANYVDHPLKNSNYFVSNPQTIYRVNIQHNTYKNIRLKEIYDSGGNLSKIYILFERKYDFTNNYTLTWYIIDTLEDYPASWGWKSKLYYTGDDIRLGDLYAIKSVDMSSDENINFRYYVGTDIDPDSSIGAGDGLAHKIYINKMPIEYTNSVISTITPIQSHISANIKFNPDFQGIKMSSNGEYILFTNKDSNYFTIGKRHQEYDTSNNLENEYYVFYNSHFSHVPGGSNNRNYSTITMSSIDYTSNYIHYLVSVRSVINTDKLGFQVMELEGYN